MYVCVRVGVRVFGVCFVCVFVDVCVCLLRVSMCVCECVWMCVCVWMLVIGWMWVCVNGRMCVGVCRCVNVCVCLCLIHSNPHSTGESPPAIFLSKFRIVFCLCVIFSAQKSVLGIFHLTVWYFHLFCKDIPSILERSGYCSYALPNLKAGGFFLPGWMLWVRVFRVCCEHRERCECSVGCMCECEGMCGWMCTGVARVCSCVGVWVVSVSVVPHFCFLVLWF